MALQDHDAAKLVKSIRDAGIDLAIMGGDAIGVGMFVVLYSCFQYEMDS